MALNPLDSSNLEQLALKGLINPNKFCDTFHQALAENFTTCAR